MKNEINMDKPEKAVTASLLDAFDLFKSPTDDLKILAGLKIHSRLRENEGGKELQYTLKRLVRSLGANIAELRMGYFAALVTILTRFPEITVTQLLELIKKELHASGSSKSEVGDVALGHILACGAVFRSGLMLKCTEEEQKEVLQLFETASSKKSYLSTVATLVFIDFINNLDEEQFATIVWPNIKQNYKKAINEHNLDSLYFLMIVNEKFPKKVKLRKLIGVPELLHEDHISDICDKLMTGVDFNSLSHPIYQECGKQIANSPHLSIFWNKIDSHLVKHNRNRELVSLNILNTVLLNLKDNVEVIPDLLSDNFFKLFMDWFKGLQTASKIRNKRDNEDDSKIMVKKQKEVLMSLAKALQLPSVDSKIRVKTLDKLLFSPGEINFTEITGSTVVKSITAGLDVDGLKKMAKSLKKVFLNSSKKVIKEGVERNWYNNERVKAAELISYMVSHEAVKDDAEFKIKYMQLLMCFGFFKIGGDESVAVSSSLAGSIKACFYRCFTSRFSNVEGLVTVLSSLSSFITSMMTKEKVRSKLEKQFDKENMDCWEMLTKVCGKIEKNQSKSKVENVFLILLYQLGLFLFSEPTHVKIASSSIIELKSCYEHYMKDRKAKTSKKENSIKDEPEWIEVVTEVLLSILSIESSVLRSVVQCVFRLLWEYLTPSSIAQIVSVLDPESEANPLGQESDLEDDEGEFDDSDEEGNENCQENEENGEHNDSEESESEMDDDDDDEKDLNTPDQLRMAIQKALGNTTVDTDVESIDADMITEEEGKKLDEALAEAFKQFHQGKNKKTKKERKNKKSLSDFRIKVLDLIDIYLEKDPAMDICLNMIAPLTRCLEFCMQDNQFKELENRVRKTIKGLSKIKKFASTDDITPDILATYLKSVIEKGERSHFMYQALGDVLTYFSVFIINCSQKIEAQPTQTPKKNKISTLNDLLKETVDNFFHNRSCLLPIIFFHNILQLEWPGKYKLASIVVKNVFNPKVRQFKRNEGVQLLSGFYLSMKRFKPISESCFAELANIEKNFKESFTATLESNEMDVKPNFIDSLKKLLNVMKNLYTQCNQESQLDFESMFNALTNFKVAVKSTNNVEESKQIIENGNKPSKEQNKKKKRKALTNGVIDPPVKKSKNKISE
ncbi:putative DNA polymerase v [Danaus plexippus plexippus]|uniref:DNA polymerase v n=1 Tax=Danaus plexippus plexippus TaxID=278856 RepID=A0A212FMQ7_DANPL|nr:putative DNA polymerase v [Danaus plexippus plexippus]